MKEPFLDRQSTAYVMAFTCSLFWGFSFLGTQVALEKIEVIPLLALRWTVSACVFLLLSAFKIIKVKYKGKNIRILLILGALQPCFYSIFETTGIKFTTPSESSIFIATIPLMVIITGAIFMHKKCSTRTTIAILIAFLGVAISVGFSPAFSIGGKWIGYLSLLMAVILSGFYSNLSNKVSEDFTAMESTMAISVMAAVFFNAINFTMGYGFSGYRICFSEARMFLSVIFLGVCCSCICYILFNFVLGKLPAATGSNLTANMTTVIGILSGVAFANDPFGWYTLVGVVMTLFGIYISSSQNSK